MRFESLTEQEFRDFAATSPYKSFTQTPEIAKLREKNGWTAYFLGVRGEDPSAKAPKTPNAKRDKILAATLLVAKPTFLGKSLFLAPGGPLLDLENAPLADFFLKNLKLFVKTHNGFLLRLDPYYELRERDRDGELVENGFDHTPAKKALEKHGFKEIDGDQPKYLFALDLESRTETELFASFKQNTRNLISRTARQGVTVRELTRDELPLLKGITEETAKRREFTDRPLSYYEMMYDLFAPKNEVKFLLAEVEIEGVKTPLSTAMFMTYGDEVIYLFSGSDEQYMKTYNAQYAIQWHMIRYALENKFKRYNFYGIRGLPDPKQPGYGIYRFKKGFGGRVIELIGTYELKVTPLATLYEALRALKAKIPRKSENNPKTAPRARKEA